MIIKKIAKFIYDEIVYNGHLQSIGVLGIVIFSSILLNIKISIISLVILYLSFYLIYLYNRYRELKIDSLTNKARTEHIKKVSKYIPYGALVLLIILAFLLYSFGNNRFTIFMLAIIILGILYTDFFKNLTKKIAIFKDIYAALVFAVLIFFPVIYQSLRIRDYLSVGIFLMMFVFFKALVMQIFLDLKDIESDKKRGLLTLGILWGKDRVLGRLKIFSIIIGILAPLFLFLHLSLPASVFMLLFLIPFNLYCFRLVKRGEFRGFIHESSEFIIWPILILLGNIIYVGLGS